MKKLGLVGGTGPESTVMYYRKIIHGVGGVLGAERLPQIAIDSLSAFEVFALCKAQRFEELAEYLLGALNNLAASGAEFAALTGNTPYIVFEKVRAATPLPLISAIEVTRDEALARGLTKVGLLGTVFTMTNDFFKQPLQDAGIEVVVPSAPEIEYIHGKIADELEHGVVKPETQTEFISIVKAMKARDDIQQLVLGCTELPLILDDQVCPVPCLDTADLHIRALVRELTQTTANVA